MHQMPHIDAYPHRWLVLQEYNTRKESKDLAAGYNLYKYIPLTDGDLTIVSPDSKTLATLWDNEQVTCLASSDSGNREKDTPIA